MKKFMCLALTASLVIASAGMALAKKTASFGDGEWVEPAAKTDTKPYFDQAAVSDADNAPTEQYPVLGSSGVFLQYTSKNSAGASATPLYYHMRTISVRGDKCYGTSHNSTLLTMSDMGKTGYENCDDSGNPTFDEDDDNNVKWDAAKWTKTDGGDLPESMQQGS